MYRKKIKPSLIKAEFNFVGHGINVVPLEAVEMHFPARSIRVVADVILVGLLQLSRG